jgi:hypothetical protein
MARLSLGWRAARVGGLAVALVALSPGSGGASAPVLHGQRSAWLDGARREPQWPHRGRRRVATAPHGGGLYFVNDGNNTLYDLPT